MIQTVNIQILGKTFPVQCDEHDAVIIENASHHIANIMQELRSTPGTLEDEELLILTILTLCKELFIEKNNALDAKNSKELVEKMILDTQQMLRD